MPHTYACPLRWADMDLLGHVNNVRYLEYAAAAREAMFDGLPVGRARVRQHRVEFVAPLVYRRTPVHVASWVTAIEDDRVSLAHEVYDETDARRTVHLRVSSVLEHRLDGRERELAEGLLAADHEWRPVDEEVRAPRDVYRVHLRRGDLDEHGHVRDVLLLELLQEARIQYLMNLHTRGQAWTHHVVARTDVRYHRPIAYRAAPYEVRSWIGHLGTSSFTIRAEVRDGEALLADASVVMVTFDKETQRPAPMAPTQRERLAQELARA